jgi:hypothetical protein
MHSASATYAPPRSRRGSSGPQPGRAARVRWDKLGRVAMLFVLLALVFLYLSAGAHLLTSWKQSHRDDATVARMESEHDALLRQHNELSSQSNLEVQARQLDMMRPGERPYIVGNLPRN